jgi:DNA-repair protein complementing XP-A cells
MSTNLIETTTRSSSLTAKNKLKQDAQAIKATRKTASFVNTTPNQPSSSRNAASGVEAAAKDLKEAPAPLARDSRLGKYFEYDLSKLHNSKGGFLTEEDGDERQKLIAIQREKARERARIAAGEEPGSSGSWDMAIIFFVSVFLTMMGYLYCYFAVTAINPETSPRCAICNSLELDHEFLRVSKRRDDGPAQD